LPREIPHEKAEVVVGALVIVLFAAWYAFRLGASDLA
jgi:hypothetical protein